MKIEKKYLEFRDLRIFYRQMGVGPPLILFHGGWASGNLNWSNHYVALARHFTLISPDHRGHGNTNNPSGKFTSYGALAWEMISFIEALELDQKPMIMGHSSGALIALHISIYEPELVAKQVLVGIHPHIGASDSFKRGMERFFNTRSYKSPPEKWRYIFSHPVNSMALWWEHRQTPWFELLHHAWPMWIKPLCLEKEDYNNIAVPTLVVFGDQDEFGEKDEAEELAQLIVNAEFQLVADANHMFVINAPEKLQKLALPFLQNSM